MVRGSQVIRETERTDYTFLHEEACMTRYANDEAKSLAASSNPPTARLGNGLETRDCRDDVHGNLGLRSCCQESLLER